MSIKKVVVIGPESTGKSTLSEDLAAALHTVWVPEYARAYLEHLRRPYEEEDLEIIAHGQLESQHKLLQHASRILVCDTDLYVVKVWSEHRYGRVAAPIKEAIAREKYDLYLLTGIDMPWEADPLREHPDERMRRYFYSVYEGIVQQTGAPWAAIKGNRKERLAAALKKIGSMRWQLRHFR